MQQVASVIRIRIRSEEVFGMWVFLSRRLRTWLVLAVVVPLVRAIVRRAAEAAAQRNPRGAASTWLGRVDSTLSSVSRRRARR